MRSRSGDKPEVKPEIDGRESHEWESGDGRVGSREGKYPRDDKDSQSKERRMEGKKGESMREGKSSVVRLTKCGAAKRRTHYAHAQTHTTEISRTAPTHRGNPRVTKPPIDSWGAPLRGDFLDYRSIHPPTTTS